MSFNAIFKALGGNKMNQAEKIGLVGMILGIGAISDVIMFYIYSNIPFLADYVWILVPIYYGVGLVGGIIGLILSIWGLSIKSSTFGIIGILTSAAAVIIVIIGFFL
jgi:hypothetical protein